MKNMMNAAERKLKLESFGHCYERLEAALSKTDRSKIKQHPNENDWSIHEVVIHLADIEANGYIRFRKAIAEPSKALSPFNPSLWCEELSYYEQDLNEALNIFKILRRSNYTLLKHLPDDSWLHTVHHPEHGLISTEDLLQIQDDHVNQQIERITTIANQFQ